MPALPTFNTRGAPSGSVSRGNGPFGKVPAPIATPNPFSDLSAVYPNLTGTNAAVSQAILSKLQGQLSPDTVNAIQDAGARFGVDSGMPGAPLQWNKSLRDLGLYSEAMQQEGIQDYNSTIPTISGTQTVNPALQTEINTQNSINAAAPDPAAAANYAQQLYDKYLKRLSGPAGGTGSSGGNAGWGISSALAGLPSGSRQIGANTYWTPYMPH